MASVWAELKRRNVVRVAVAYVVVTWLLLQASDVLVPLLGLPDWVGKLVFFLLLIGFPIALLFAWAFELTPEGLKKEKDVDRSESITHMTGRKLDFVIIAVLVLALIVFAVERFVWQSGADTVSGGAGEIVATKSHSSIAVLPFVNMSNDPDNEYFSDGLSEEILNLLAKIPELKVIARTSSFAFKGRNEDVRAIGDALGAKTVLEGSVRKSGDRVRITAQLIDVADGAHIWSDTYDRTMTDIFEVQDSVAAAIIDALQLHVGKTPTRGRPTDNTEAYTLFLQARAIMNAFEDTRMAEALLLEAIELDADFAEAYELLAFAYWYLAGVVVQAAEGQALVAEAAAKALAIDPELVFAQALYQSANVESYSFIGEIRGLERAAREEPSNTEILDALAFDLVESGYLREALGYAERFVELDPLSANAHGRLFEALHAVGRDDKAWAAADTSVKLGSEFMKYRVAAAKYTILGDDSDIRQLEADGNEYFLPWAEFRALVEGAREPAGGPAYLDRRIPEVLAGIDEADRYNARLNLTGLYLQLGFLDRYYELILESDLKASTWTDADVWIHLGTIIGRRGFTSHPRYVEVAELTGMVDVWEQRGPPDFCNKVDGRWTCE